MCCIGILWCVWLQYKDIEANFYIRQELRLNNTILTTENKRLRAYIQSQEPVVEEVLQLHITVTPEKTLNKVYLGEFVITHYCACEICCGKTDGVTKSGELVTEGVTIAVDTRKIKLGTKVFIEGLGVRTAQDTGGAIKQNRIDVYVKTHEEALQLGKYTAKVYIYKED